MKNAIPFLLVFILCLVLVVASVADQINIPVNDNAANVTNTASASGGNYSGFFNSVIIAAPTAWTGTVVIATLFETLFTSPAITQTNIFRPRVPVDGNTGVSLAGTNDFEAVYLAGDPINVTVTSTPTATTNNIVVRVRLSRDR